MKKIDKILDMFDELLKSSISSDEAVFIVANSFYTSKDEKINRDTLFRYIKSQIDIEKFHEALKQRDLSIINPERYLNDKNNAIIDYKENYFFDKNISENLDDLKVSKENDDLLKNINQQISPEFIINEINSLKEKLDYFNKINGRNLGILVIPKDDFIVSEKNIKRATFRIEENLLKKLEDFCKNHKEYNKTLIINFMIKEFLENYNK